MTCKSLIALVLATAGAVSASRADLPTLSPSEALSRPGPIGRGSDAQAKPLIGTKPPAFPAIRWLDGRTRNLETLSGRVVLIRSFTNACPFCAASLPTLQALHDEYAPRGLVVLGVYHAKPRRPVASEDVVRFARALGANFPVGIDPDWRLLEAWWPGRAEPDWTSVTWLLGRDGVIRYVHPGGEYHASGGRDHDRCRADERDLRATVERLLRETV
ncbi:MAG TPA: TlpA family protein disulfide reductase [Candidatus Polarisedimenticolia bacterium]|nr:TlpA family protein disulfide reductase [Candidatus Polarisedimenticolia bacterium]